MADDNNMFAQSRSQVAWLPSMEALAQNPNYLQSMFSLGRNMQPMTMGGMATPYGLPANFGPSFTGHANPGFGAYSGAFMTESEFDLRRAQSAQLANTQYFMNQTDTRAYNLLHSVGNMANPSSNAMGIVGFGLNNITMASQLMGGSTNALAFAASSILANGPVINQPQYGAYTPSSSPTNLTMGYHTAVADKLRQGITDKYGFSNVDGVSLSEMSNLVAVAAAKGMYKSAVDVTEKDGVLNETVDDVSGARMTKTSQSLGALAQRVKGMMGAEGLSGNVLTVIEAFGGKMQDIEQAMTKMNTIMARARAAGAEEGATFQATAQLASSFSGLGFSQASSGSMAQQAVSAALAGAMRGGMPGRDRLSDQYVIATTAAAMGEVATQDPYKYQAAARTMGLLGIEGVNDRASMDKWMRSNLTAVQKKEADRVLATKGSTALIEFLQTTGHIAQDADIGGASYTATREAITKEVATRMSQFSDEEVSESTMSGMLGVLSDTGAVRTGKLHDGISAYLRAKTPKEKADIRDKYKETFTATKDGKSVFDHLDVAGKTMQDVLVAGDSQGAFSRYGVFQNEKDLADAKRKAAEELYKIESSPAALGKLLPIGEKLLRGYLDAGATKEEKEAFNTAIVQAATTGDTSAFASREARDLVGGSVSLTVNGERADIDLSRIGSIVNNKDLDLDRMAAGLKVGLNKAETNTDVSAGLLKELEVANSIKDPDKRRQALTEVANKMYRAGTKADVATVFNTLKDSGLKIHQVVDENKNVLNMVTQNYIGDERAKKIAEAEQSYRDKNEADMIGILSKQYTTGSKGDIEDVIRMADARGIKIDNAQAEDLIRKGAVLKSNLYIKDAREAEKQYNKLTGADTPDIIYDIGGRAGADGSWSIDQVAGSASLEERVAAEREMLEGDPELKKSRLAQLEARKSQVSKRMEEKEEDFQTLLESAGRDPEKLKQVEKAREELNTMKQGLANITTVIEGLNKRAQTSEGASGPVMELIGTLTLVEGGSKVDIKAKGSQSTTKP